MATRVTYQIPVRVRGLRFARCQMLRIGLETDAAWTFVKAELRSLVAVVDQRSEIRLQTER